MRVPLLTAPKTILITGGAGFIGSYLVKKLLRSGNVIHVLDNLSTGSLHNLPEHQNLFFHQGSILDESVLKSLQKVKFDLIFHLASIVGMRLATRYQQLVYDTATIGTLNVLNTWREAPVVLFSSSAVYGMDNTWAVKEDLPIAFDQLLNYDGGKLGYACGKWEMEQIGLRASKQGRRVLIVRPFNVIGKRQVGTYGMVVPTFINQALQGMPLTIYDDGLQVRSFSCVKMFTDCLLKLTAAADVWQAGGNIVNIGSRNGYSINDLARIVVEATKSHSPVKYHLYQDFFENHKDVIYRVPDTTYGEQFYGTMEWPTLTDMVQDILQSAMAQGAKQVNPDYVI